MSKIAVLAALMLAAASPVRVDAQRCASARAPRPVPCRASPSIWGAARGTTAPSSVEAIDFLSINSSPSYMDNFQLLEFIPVELMSFTVG